MKRDSDTPNPGSHPGSHPGSDEAVALGCTCAQIDNRYGKGNPWLGLGNMFWINADCPIHGGHGQYEEVADE